MKIALNLHVCRGNGTCVVAAPDLFDYDDETGQAIALAENVPDDQDEYARMAVLHCPTGAISLEGGS